MRQAISAQPEKTPAESLHWLALRVRSLVPRHGDPERYHLEKDEIAKALLRLARQMERVA